MLRSTVRACALVAIGLSLAVDAATVPRITFERISRAPHDLAPAQHLAVISALGDSEMISVFVENFVDQTNRVGTLHLDNAVELNHHLADLHSVRRDHPADAYIAIRRFTCIGAEHSAEGSEHDVDGGRVKRTHHWIDATCTARVAVLGQDGRERLAYSVLGEGTSPRSASLTAEEREVAYLQASRYAAIAAADGITPRPVRESIELDETGFAFEEGYAMITADRLSDARAIWEAALGRHDAEPALHFNLGAVSEAQGDLKAAERYFEEASALAPASATYTLELRRFHKRNRTAKPVGVPPRVDPGRARKSRPH